MEFLFRNYKKEKERNDHSPMGGSRKTRDVTKGMLYVSVLV